MSADLNGKGGKGEQDGNPAQWVLIPGQGGPPLGKGKSKGTGKGEEYVHEEKGGSKALLGKGKGKGKGNYVTTEEATAPPPAARADMFDPRTGIFTFAMFKATSKFP
jgi:hypothetical protein